MAFRRQKIATDKKTKFLKTSPNVLLLSRQKLNFKEVNIIKKAYFKQLHSDSSAKYTNLYRIVSLLFRHKIESY